MNFPLAELELSRTGKRVSTYAVRGVAVGIAWFVMGVVWFFSVLIGEAEGQSGAELGEFYSAFLAYASRVFQFLAVFVVAPLFSAGLVAREKQERTLGLLLMADLRGRDIFLAKYLSAFLYVELLVLSALPILAFASIFGGVSVPEMALQVFLLTIATATMCAVGLFFSTTRSRPVEAVFATILFECAWIMGTFFFDFIVNISYLVGPGTVVTYIFPTTSILSTAWNVNQFSASPEYWVLSAGITLFIGLIAALLTIHLLPRQAWDKPSSRHTGVCLPRERKRRRFLRRKKPGRARRAARTLGAVHAPRERVEAFLGRRTREEETVGRPRRRRGALLLRPLFPMGPIARLASASVPGLAVFRQSWPVQLLIALALTPLGLFGCTGCLGNMPIFLIICYDITSSISGARKDGSFDDLLITPTDDRSLSRGLFAIYVRRGLLFFPALVLSGLYSLFLYGGGPFTLGSIPLTVVYQIVGLVVTPFVSLLFCVTLGCWASTFNFGPAGQTFAGLGNYLGVTIALSIFNTILVSIAMILFESSSITEEPWPNLFSVLPVGIPLALTSLVSLGFYQMFARHLATKWRTGSLLFSRPASR